MSARNILVINCGSSSLKFALVNESQDVFPFQGLAERLGSPEAVVQWQVGDAAKETRQIPNGAHREALEAILPMAQEIAGGKLDGIGHRVVHGGEDFTGSCLIDDAVLEGIRANAQLARCTTRPT